MKIVAGLGSIDEYIPYVKAGADEFCHCALTQSVISDLCLRI